MICEGCKYAKWALNAKGHKHPSGQGKCTWAIEVPVAGSARLPGFYGQTGSSIKAEGGYIWRKKGEEHPKSCDVRAPEKADT